jgi:hypothetical protein
VCVVRFGVWNGLCVDEVANERMVIDRNLSVGLFLLSSSLWNKIFGIVVGNMSNAFVRSCQPDQA